MSACYYWQPVEQPQGSIDFTLFSMICAFRGLNERPKEFEMDESDLDMLRAFKIAGDETSHVLIEAIKKHKRIKITRSYG